MTTKVASWGWVRWELCIDTVARNEGSLQSKLPRSITYVHSTLQLASSEIDNVINEICQRRRKDDRGIEVKESG